MCVWVRNVYIWARNVYIWVRNVYVWVRNVCVIPDSVTSFVSVISASNIVTISARRK